MSYNILITSVGRRVSLTKYFQKELKEQYPGSSVFTTDLNTSFSAAAHISDESFDITECTNPEYIDDLLSLSIKHKVNILIPTIDTELRINAENRNRFLAHGINLIVSDIDFVNVCRDKRKMNSFFIENGFKVPKEVDRNNPTIPAFIKPFNGSNSQDLYLIDHPNKVSKYLRKNLDLMWLEYLPKEKFTEFTVDLYYDKEGYLKCCVPRVRISVRGGETNKGITRKSSYLIDYIRERMGFVNGARGCLTLQLFQSKSDENDIYGIEINPRFGGGYPLSYLAGANYPKWIIDEYISENPIEYFEDWKDNMLLLRYDNEMTISDYQYNT